MQRAVNGWQLKRIAILLIIAGGLYLAMKFALEDGYIAAILSGIAFVTLAPLVLEQAPRLHAGRRGGSREE